jgi:outer membrane protease
MGKLCFFVLLAALALGLFAEENQANDLNLSMEASLGLLSGRGEELVYRDKDTDDKLSQLLWDFKPLVYAGLGIDFSWRKPENKWGVFTDALFKFGIPGGSGVMEDRDWMALNYPDFLTHYSVHDNRTEKAVLIDADIGASFQIFENFLLKTYISYSFMYFSWTANGGSLLYPNWDY